MNPKKPQTNGNEKNSKTKDAKFLHTTVDTPADEPGTVIRFLAEYQSAPTGRPAGQRVSTPEIRQVTRPGK